MPTKWRSLGELHRLAEVDEMRQALIAAVKVVKQWHNMPSAGKAPGPGLNRLMQEAWVIYWRHAPEMDPIRAALPEVNLDEVEKL